MIYKKTVSRLAKGLTEAQYREATFRQGGGDETRGYKQQQEQQSIVSDEGRV